MAFRGDSTGTYTYATNSTGGTVDMGARNNYRYVNATNVYNKGKSDGVTAHTGTYTFSSGNGATVDLGTTHTYRYVNATNVYNKGKADGSGSLTANLNKYEIGTTNGLTGISAKDSYLEVCGTKEGGQITIYKNGTTVTRVNEYGSYGGYRIDVFHIGALVSSDKLTRSSGGGSIFSLFVIN